MNNEDTTVEEGSKPRLIETRQGIAEIKKHLETLETSSAVDAYAKEVAKMCPNPTDKQRYTIQTMFTNRREDIIAKSRTA